MTEQLLRVEALAKTFPGRRSLGDVLARRPAQPVRAVDGVSFELGARCWRWSGSRGPARRPSATC